MSLICLSMSLLVLSLKHLMIIADGKTAGVVLMSWWFIWTIKTKLNILLRGWWTVVMLLLSQLMIVIATFSTAFVVGQSWCLTWWLVLELRNMNTSVLIWIMLLLILLSHQLIGKPSLVVLIIIRNRWMIVLCKVLLLHVPIVNLILSMWTNLSSPQTSTLSSVDWIDGQGWSIFLILVAL